MKNPQTIINALSPEDALHILKKLASEDDALAVRIADMANTLLSQVDFEEIAENLLFELEALEVEAVWDRAGRTRHGYVEPNDAAYSMVEEVIEPFLNAMKKYRQMGLHAQADEQCKGMLLGLNNFEHDSSEFKDWAADLASIFAEETLGTWKAENPPASSIRKMEEFLNDELPGWIRL